MTRFQNIPWLRIVAESIAIVVSILLAFAIDAWWTNLKSRQDVEENLSALVLELESNLELIERELSYRQAVIASIESLNTTVANERTLSPDEIDRFLGEMLMATNYRVVEYRDHSQLLYSDEFLGLLTQQHWDHVNVQDALKRLTPRVEKAIALIEVQIQ